MVTRNFLAKIKILAKSSVYSKVTHSLRKVTAKEFVETKYYIV